MVGAPYIPPLPQVVNAKTPTICTLSWVGGMVSVSCPQLLQSSCFGFLESTMTPERHSFDKLLDLTSWNHPTSVLSTMALVYWISLFTTGMDLGRRLLLLRHDPSIVYRDGLGRDRSRNRS